MEELLVTKTPCLLVRFFTLLVSMEFQFSKYLSSHLKSKKAELWAHRIKNEENMHKVIIFPLNLG